MPDMRYLMSLEDRRRLAELYGDPAEPSEPLACAPQIIPEPDELAPHGRDDQGHPLAPYGWTTADKNGPSRPRKTTAGRKPGSPARCHGCGYTLTSIGHQIECGGDS